MSTTDIKYVSIHESLGEIMICMLLFRDGMYTHTYIIHVHMPYRDGMYMRTYIIHTPLRYGMYTRTFTIRRPLRDGMYKRTYITHMHAYSHVSKDTGQIHGYM